VSAPDRAVTDQSEPVTDQSDQGDGEHGNRARLTQFSHGAG
jgi:hypothetical protein